MSKLNQRNLKIIALIAMTVNHFAEIILSDGLPVRNYFLVIGRIAMPIFAMLISQGFQYTTNKKKYFFRLLFFGLISNLAFSIAFEPPIYFGSAIMTLFLGYCILCIHTASLNLIIKNLGIIFILFGSCFCDWGICAPLWVLIFYQFRDNKKIQILLFAITGMIYDIFMATLLQTLLNFGFLISVPLLILYEPDKKRQSPFMKWFTYGYYPAHLILLKVISLLV